MGRLRPRKSARAPRRARARRACTARVLARSSNGARSGHVCSAFVGVGLRAREQRMVFEHLPLLSVDIRTQREMMMVGNWQRWGSAGATNGQKKDAEGMVAFHETELAAGVEQANALARVVDLRNANGAED